MSPRGVGLIAALVVAVVVAGGYFYYANFSPDGGHYPVRGIDVSHHQGPIDWPRVARSGISFAFLKATEGGTHVDENFRENFEGARATGIAVGAYHFFTFCKSGAEQAANFIAAVPHEAGMLPPVVDIEFGGNCAARPTVDEFAKELGDFLTPVEQGFGQRAIVYLAGDAVETYGNAVPDRPRWVRSIVWPPLGQDWLVWQYHNSGRVDGIDGIVDLNVLQGDRQTLEALRKP
jgi:lysozyme